MPDWVALSDREMPAEPGHILERGAFVMELALPLPETAVLLDHRGSDGWRRGFSVFHDEIAGLGVMHRQGSTLVRHSLPGPLPREGGTARIVLHWDAPARTWSLRYEIAATGFRAEAQGTDALPLPVADLAAMCSLTGPARRHPAVLWFGATRGAAPPDRAPWIGLSTPIGTERGLRPAGSLQPGDLVKTADGLRPLQTVRRMDLPGRGHFTPVLLRAPFFASGVDLLVSADQLIALSGAEVEYLFGEDEVLAEARHLVDGRSALFDTRRAVTCCVALDTGQPALLLSQGCALNSGHAAALPRRLLRGYEAVPLLSLLGRSGRSAA